MRGLFLAGCIVLAGLSSGGYAYGMAQEQNAPPPDNASQQPSGAAQPQKKPEKKPGAPAKTKSKTATKAAAQPSASAKPDSAGQPPPASAADQNPFPEAVSQRAAQSQETPAAPTKPSSADANPFPEAVSRNAAKAAGGAGAPAGSGVSSSQASSLTGDEPPPPEGGGKSPESLEVTNPARAKKDTQVGDFYLAAGDAKGAYLRYKDAIGRDPGDVDAIFGLAQAGRQLNKFDEAARNYQIYLAVMPNGPKAKEARKALRELSGKK